MAGKNTTTGKSNGRASFEERCNWGAGSVVFKDKNGNVVDVTKLSGSAKKPAAKKPTTKKK